MTSNQAATPSPLAPFDLALIDSALRDTLLPMLTPYRAFDVAYQVLDRIMIELINGVYPLEITFRWLTGNPAPPDVYERRAVYFDFRSYAYPFWDRLTRVDYGPPQPRWPDGTRVPDETLIAALLTQLTTHVSFEVAINTWFAVCVAWLGVCNADAFLAEAARTRTPIPLPQDIPYYICVCLLMVYD